MRFSNIQMYNQNVQNLTRLKQESNAVQEQITTGKRVNRPSDDPIAAARIIHLQDELAMNSQYQSNIEAIEFQGNIEEVHIASAENILVRMRELTIQANNAGLQVADRQSIAKELKSLNDEMLSIANARDVNGNFVFAGFQNQQQPFSASIDGQVQFVGDEGLRQIKVSATSSLAMNTSGKSIFIDIPSSASTFYTMEDPANNASPPALISMGSVIDQDTYTASFDTYPEDYRIEFNTPPDSFNVYRQSDGGVELSGVAFSSGQDIEFNGIRFEIKGTPAAEDQFYVQSSSTQSIFDTVAKLSQGLNSFNELPETSDKLTSLVNASLEQFDNALDKMLQARSAIGSKLNVTESNTNLLKDVELLNKEILSDMRDVNYEEAISKLTFQNFVLEAAQQTFARVSQLSLFNFL